jgi:predicted ATPase/class 3 adenylate cyclase
MFNLIPRFIQNHVDDDLPHGVIDAATLFMDISGFVPMTQALMEHGVEGAEWVSGLVNRLFEPSIAEIHRRGGVITGFAGDSFTAVFPLSAPDAAADVCAAAIRIKQFFESQPIQRTPYGEFSFAVKVGLGRGDVEWGILGPDEHRTFYFRGAGIEASIQAEQRARPGDLILHPDLAALLPSRLPRVTDAANFQVLDPAELAYLEIQDLEGDSEAALVADEPRDLLKLFFPQLVRQDQSRGEFREAAIVFLALPEGLDHTALHQLVTLIIQLADQFGGFFSEIEFGDKGGLTVLYFGAPLGHENNVRRALDYLSALHESARDVPWRAGVTYGTVYAGFFGAQARGKYGLLGDPVNFAARLIERTTPGQILVSEAVERDLSFRFSALAPGHFKGYAEPIRTAYLVGKRRADEQVFPPQMFGADALRQRLQDSAAPLLLGKSAGTIIVLGEAGVGKSHLAYLLRQNLREQAQWFTGQTDQILKRPLSPFVYWLKHYFLYRPEATAEENQSAFAAKFRDLQARVDNLETDPALTRAELERVQRLAVELPRAEPFLSALLDIHGPDSLFEKIENPRLRFQNTLAAVRTLLRAEACNQPLVLTIEDAQGLDPASLELLAVLHRGLVEYPALLLLLARVRADGNEPELNLGDPDRIETLWLTALNPDDLRNLAEYTLGAGISLDLQSFLHEKTHANPLFVQQLLLQLRQQELISFDDEIWQLHGQPEIQGGIVSSLVARLDQFDPDLRTLVQTAAILGQEFDRRILAELEPVRLKHHFRAAMLEHVWSRVADHRYRFNHTLLRDAAYNVQLRSQVMEIHAKAGHAFEQVFQRDLSPHYVEIVYHFRRARDRINERDYTYLAARQASDRFAAEDAARLHQRALELTDPTDRPRRFEIALELEKTYRASGDRAAQFKMLQLLRELAAVMGAAEQAITAQRQALLHHVMAAYHESISAAETAIRLARENGDIALELDGRYLLGANYLRMGNYRKGSIVLEAALAIAHTHDLGLLAGKIETSLGHISCNLGQYDAAKGHYQRSLALAQEEGDKLLESHSLNGLGRISSDHTGELLEALTYYHESLALKEEVGDVLAQAISLRNLSQVHSNLGNFDQALELGERSLDIRREVDDRRGEGRAHVMIAAIKLAMGDVLPSETHVREALAIALEVGEKRGEADSYAQLGEVLQATGRFAEAKAAFAASHELRQDLFENHRAAIALTGAAQAELSLDNPAGAQRMIDEVIGPISDPHDLGGVETAKALLALYKVLAELEDPRASGILEAAHEKVQTQADSIHELGQRRRFLLQVPWNRAILEAFHNANPL